MNTLAQYRLWVSKWKREFSSSTDSSTDHIATLSYQQQQLSSSVTTMGSDRENPGAPNLNGPNGGPQV
jgi:hypothetical protein